MILAIEEYRRYIQLKRSKCIETPLVISYEKFFGMGGWYYCFCKTHIWRGSEVELDQSFTNLERNLSDNLQSARVHGRFEC